MAAWCGRWEGNMFVTTALAIGLAVSGPREPICVPQHHTASHQWWACGWERNGALNHADLYITKRGYAPAWNKHTNYWSNTKEVKLPIAYTTRKH